MAKLLNIYKSSHKLSLVTLIFASIVIFWTSFVITNAQPPITEIKADTVNEYEELHFVAEKGVQYTLQKSQDLDDWDDDLSFIGNGQLVKLRLFALNTNVLPQNGNDNPFLTVSAHVRKVDTGGTSISWVSIEDQTIKYAHLPTIELNPNFPNAYTGLKNGYYLFLSLESSIATAKTDSPVSGSDLTFKNALITLLVGIQNDTNAGTPPMRPHRPVATPIKQFWRMNTNPDIDSDGDNVTDSDEVANGTDNFDGDDGGDSDQDGIPNEHDADPLDKAVNWKRVAEVPYVVTDIGLPTGVNLADGWYIKLGDGGHVLLSKNTEVLWPGGLGVPEKTYFRTYAWDPSTGIWFDLELPDNLRGIGSFIDYKGNIYGRGYGALGSNAEFPGYKETSIRFKKNAQGGWMVADTELEDELGASFSNEPGTWTDDPSYYSGGDNYAPRVFGYTGHFVLTEEKFQLPEHAGHIQRIVSPSKTVGNPFAIAEGFSTPQISDYRAAGDFNGWHAAIWNRTTILIPTEHYIFSKLLSDDSLIHANPPTGASRNTLTDLTSINANYLPSGTDDIIIWANETDDFQFGSRSEQSENFTWQLSTRVDQTQRIDGKINGRGEGLKLTELWRNGTWTPLDDLVDSALWPNITGNDINNAGQILARTGSENKLIIIAPIGVVELSPKLVDENDDEIEGSDRPELAPKSTEMVERDPLADTPILDASTVRIAWRDIKVRLGVAYSGTTVTWSMESETLPLYPGPFVQDIRGKWAAAANSNYRHRFSASESYGLHDFVSTNPEAEVGTGQNVSTTATTTVDVEGYTAIRVNLPSIGLNKARIKIAIQGVEDEIELIDLEVPAVIVIDPGHGGPLSTSHSTSSWNNATSATGILEKAMTLNLGLKLGESLNSKMKNQKYKARVLLTRRSDVNPTGPERSNIAGLNGADIFLSIHFNGGGSNVTAIGPEMWIYPEGPPQAGYNSAYNASHQINYQADYDFARRILSKTVTVLGQPERGAGVKGYLYNQNTNYAATPANVYQDINTYLKNVAVPGIESQYLPLSRAALLEAGYITDPIIDNWFNGASGEINSKALADGLADTIIEDITLQP